MARTITLEGTSDAQEQLLRQVHSFVMEMDSLALRAPDGQGWKDPKVPVTSVDHEPNRPNAGPGPNASYSLEEAGRVS